MDMFSDIKAVMNDLQQRKAALGEQLQEFQRLQLEINALIAVSDRDPAAMAKLIKLKQAFPGGFESQQATVMNKVSELEQHFKGLEQQFNLLGNIAIGEVNNIEPSRVPMSETNTVNTEVPVKAKKLRVYL